MKKDHQLNLSSLSKKYRCDVNRLIRFWKKGHNDFEISQALGIDMIKLLQIRQEIASIYEKKRSKENSKTSQKPYFMLKPR